MAFQLDEEDVLTSTLVVPVFEGSTETARLNTEDSCPDILLAACVLMSSVSLRMALMPPH